MLRDIKGCIRPSGWMRIETISRLPCRLNTSRCIRPSGWMRIETRPSPISRRWTANVLHPAFGLDED